MRPNPVLAIVAQRNDLDAWVAALRQRMPELDIRIWPDCGDLAEIDAAFAWRQPAGVLKRFPNLRFIQNFGAGVDNLVDDPDLPDGVPFCRMVDPDLTAGMSEYVMMAVLRYHRQVPQYEALQRECRWQQLPAPRARRTRIGVMGLGELGADAARKAMLFGFPVAGWSRSRKRIEGMESFAGMDELPAFLARTDILVCLLPLTPETRGIVNARTLGLLPRGAYFINAARGGHHVDVDLLAALESGQLAGATLDVFEPEPLPATHGFWRHPKVLMTPHAASFTNPETAAAQVVENIRRMRDGRKLLNVVDRRAGY
jgi:glyoxylate/hydroxypyruvate reductase A